MLPFVFEVIMIYIKPDFYDKFSCKADKCTDTCCAGWEVDIDADSLGKYKAVSGVFGKRLIDNIVYDEDIAYFRLKEADRCVFLDDCGLCDIYSELGEGFLCEICREHPRFYDFFDGIEEVGLGLCCEKTCELLFESEEPLSFVCDNDGAEDETDADDEVYFNIRENCFNIIKNREVPLGDRIKNLFGYVTLAQNECFADSFEFKTVDEKQLLCEIADAFEQTEPINAQWSDYVSEIKKNISSVSVREVEENKYERVLTYIIYRHFMKSRFSGNVIAPIAFAVASLVFIYVCESIFSADLVSNVKFWSKQIEYSEFNTDFLMQKSFELFVI